MIINDNIKPATVTLANFAANAPIGTAAATVDIASSFRIPQTTVNITLSIPTPTDTAAGNIVLISNTGSVAVTIVNTHIRAGRSALFQWNGSAWANTFSKLTAPATAPVITAAGTGLTMTQVTSAPIEAQDSVSYVIQCTCTQAVSNAWHTLTIPLIAGYSTPEIVVRGCYRSSGGETGYPAAPCMNIEASVYSTGNVIYVGPSNHNVATTRIVSFNVTYYRV